MPEAMPAWVFGTPDMTPLVIGELTMPAPIPNRAYVTIRYACFVSPVRRDSAAQLMVNAVPAMTRGIRGPRLATIRPATGPPRPMTTRMATIVMPPLRAHDP